MILAFLSFKFNQDAHAEVDGFRDLQWGTRLSTIKDQMNYVRTDPSYGGVKIYSRKNEDLRMYNVEVQSIGYSFWMDKLSSVIVRFRGFSNFVHLRDSLFKRFGKGHNTKRFIKGYVWDGEVTNMALEYNKVVKEGYLFLYSIGIQKEQQRFVEK